MAWIYVVIAGLLEIVWAWALKQMTHPGSATDWQYWLLLVSSASLSLYLLWLAMRELPLSVAYPVWVAFGALGTMAVGVLFLGEALGPVRATGLGLMLVAMVLVKVG